MSPQINLSPTLSMGLFCVKKKEFRSQKRASENVKIAKIFDGDFIIPSTNQIRSKYQYQKLLAARYALPTTSLTTSFFLFLQNICTN